MKRKKSWAGPSPELIMAGLEWPSGEEARKNVQIQFCPAEFPVTAVVLVRGGRWFESRRLKVFFEMAKGRKQRY